MTQDNIDFKIKQNEINSRNPILWQFYHRLTLPVRMSLCLCKLCGQLYNCQLYTEKEALQTIYDTFRYKTNPLLVCFLAAVSHKFRTFKSERSTPSFLWAQNVCIVLWYLYVYSKFTPTKHWHVNSHTSLFSCKFTDRLSCSTMCTLKRIIALKLIVTQTHTHTQAGTPVNQRFHLRADGAPHSPGPGHNTSVQFTVNF